MLLIRFACDILNSGKDASPILADHLADTVGESDLSRYLRMPETLRVRTVLNVIEKHGTRQERRLMSKAFRKAMKNRGRSSKGAANAYLKKAWSLNDHPTWLVKNLREELKKILVRS